MLISNYCAHQFFPLHISRIIRKKSVYAWSAKEEKKAHQTIIVMSVRCNQISRPAHHIEAHLEMEEGE